MSVVDWIVLVVGLSAFASPLVFDLLAWRWGRKHGRG